MHFARYLLVFIYLITIQPLIADQFETFTKAGKVGLKNTTTDIVVIPAQYEKIGWSDGSFSIIKETIGASQNEKWALIDLEGKHITSHKFEQLIPRNDDSFIASIRKTNSILTNYGLIDSKGKTQISFEYSSINDHPAGLIVGKRNGSRYEQGFLDNKGKEIISVEYKNIKPLSDKHLAVRNFKNLEAIYSFTGEALTDFSYDQINRINDRFYQISQFNHLGILSQDIQLVVPPLYKDISIESDRAKLTPYKQWDYFKNDNYYSTLYYDELGFLAERLISNAGEKAAILDDSLKTEVFYSNEKLIDSRSEVFITQESNSKRFKVYDRNGKALFRYSLDAVQLYDEVLFTKRSEASDQPWTAYLHNGEQLSLSQYQKIYPRKEGFFEVERNNKRGLISSDGSMIGPILYDSISVFKNDRAIAFYGGKKGVINERGNWVLTPYYDSLSILEDHIAFKQGTNRGLTDHYGNVLMRTRSNFQYYGSAITYRTDSLETIISIEGDTLLEYQYDFVRALSNEILLLQREDRKFIYRPKDKYDIELDRNLEEIQNAINGYIPVKINAQWGYLNRDGQIAVANRYENVTQYSEGLFGVKILGKWGFVNENDQIIIQPNYDFVEPFRNGMAVVQQGQYFGLINKEGQTILKIEYDRIMKNEDYILLLKGRLMGLANLNGRIIKNPSFSSIKPLENGYFQVERNGLYGVIDKSGNDVIPTIYKTIKQSGNNFLASKNGEEKFLELR